MEESAKVYSEDDRLALGQAALSLLDDWGLNGEQQVVMLGLDANHSISLDVLMRGEPLPDDEDVLERASRFLNLSLSLIALHNYESAKVKDWMVLGNDEIGGNTPFNFIRDYGVTGLAWLDDHLSRKSAEQNNVELAFSTAS